jgi:hypothetical protein
MNGLHDEAFRYIYALSLRWSGSVLEGALVALLVAFVLAAWRLWAASLRRPAAGRSHRPHPSPERRPACP